MRVLAVIVLAVISAIIAGVAASSHNADHDILVITRYPWLTGLITGVAVLASGCLVVIALAVERQQRRD